MGKLTLKRKREQSIVINPGKPGEITITIKRTHTSTASVQIDAPDEFRIVRGELIEEPKEHAA